MRAATSNIQRVASQGAGAWGHALARVTTRLRIEETNATHIVHMDEPHPAGAARSARRRLGVAADRRRARARRHMHDAHAMPKGSVTAPRGRLGLGDALVRSLLAEGFDATAHMRDAHVDVDARGRALGPAGRRSRGEPCSGPSWLPKLVVGAAPPEFSFHRSEKSLVTSTLYPEGR